jgi:hypothetical protein
MLTPLGLAILIGTFWAGVGTAAVVSHNDGFNRAPRQDVVISATTDDHIAACHARYRSYQEDTDMWLGNDGNWHPCQL